MRELDWHECYSKNLKGIISNEAFSHPAKFAYGLIVRIYAHLLERGWLQEGDLVTDPFAGVGVGGIVAAAHGLRWIGIELEQKFVDLTVGFECDGVVERHQERAWIEPRPSGWFVRLRIKAQYWDASGETGFGGPKGDGWDTEQEAQAFADSIADSEEVQGYPLSTLHWEPVEGHYATKWVCDKPAKCGSCEPHGPHHVTGSFELHREQWDKMGKPYPIILQGDSRNFSSIIREAIDSIVTSPPFQEQSRFTDDRPSASMKSSASYQRQSRGSFDAYGDAQGQIGAMKEGNPDEVVAGIVTSPAYAESLLPETEEQTRRKQERIAKAKTIHDGRALEKPSPGKAALGGGYGVSKGQLGAMKEGDLDEVVAVITSPAYADSIHDPATGDLEHRAELLEAAGHDAKRWLGQKRCQQIRAGGYGKTEGQLGAMEEGGFEEVVDGVITSAPYAESLSSEKCGIDFTKAKKDYPGRIMHEQRVAASKRRHDDMQYSSSPDNLGNLPEGNHEAVVNGVVTSPPYEKAMHGGSKILRQDGSYRPDTASAVGATDYSCDPCNIGNQQGDTYWAAVAQVYSECFKTLRPNGIMVVVVKDFVRQGQRVPLCDQTFELLKAIGFKPLERIRAWVVSEAEQKSLMPNVVPDYRKARKSFFRRLAERGGSPRIDWEEVLICQKAD